MTMQSGDSRSATRGSLSGSIIIYDLDGTFIDTAEDLWRATNHVLVKAWRKPVPLEVVRGFVGHGARAMLEQGFAYADGAPLADKEVLAGAVGEFVSHYRAHIADHSRPFPGAVETLIDMQNAGAVCVICTNKREALAVALLEALDLTDCFSAIVGGDNASAAKPDPAPVRLSMAQAGFEPDAVINAGRAVFIGDSDTDIRAAKNTGVPVLLHNQGYGPLSEAAHVDGAFDQFDQLPNLVRGLIK